MKFSNLLLCILLIAVLTVCEAVADKLTRDPNASRAAAQPETAAFDARLSQKIGYQSGCKRVHDVASDLDDASDVYIGSGSNRFDWQARDIPLIVCAQDVPLGKLLQAIADATHLSFRSTTKGDDPDGAARRYRLYRTRKASAEIAAYNEAKHSADVADAQWVLDGLSALASLPASKRKELAAGGQSADMTLALGAMVRVLGAEDRAALLNGQSVRIGTDRADHDIAVRGLLRIYGRHQTPAEGEDGISVKSGSVTVSFDEQFSLRTNVEAEWDSVESGSSAMVGNVGGLGHQVQSLADLAGMDLPPRPTGMQASVVEDSPGSDYRSLRIASDWDMPVLRKRLSIVRPESMDKPTRADVLTALANASGCTIVCEDFQSHMAFVVDEFPASDTTLAESLRRIRGIDWFIDEERCIIIGWANDWRIRHTNLISEGVYAGLRDRLEGSGVTLEDALGLLDLTAGQFGDWILRSRDLAPLRQASFSGPAFGLWKLYATLSPDQKAMARTETGLSLSTFDPAWVVDFVKLAAKSAPQTVDYRTMTSLTPSGSELDSPSSILSDPRRVGSYAVHLATEELRSAADEKTRCRYTMVLLDSSDPAKPPVRAGGPTAIFPILATFAQEPVLPGVAH